MVPKFPRITGRGAKGVTRARRYSSAGSISPSLRARPDDRSFCTVPSKVVRRAARYAVGDRSVFCSSRVASRARSKVAGAFWWAREEDVWGRILVNACSRPSDMVGGRGNNGHKTVCKLQPAEC